MPLYEFEAKKRQATSGKGIYGGKPLVPKMAHAVSRARDQASKAFNVGRSYIQDMKKIKAKHIRY